LLKNQNFKRNSAQKFVRKLVLVFKKKKKNSKTALCNKTAAQISNLNKLIEIFSKKAI
jgi:hypothetical protein